MALNGMKPPSNIVELLRRLFPPKEGEGSECRPFIAAVTPLAVEDQAGAPTWAIVHSVTGDGVRLLHPRPLTGNRLSLSVHVEHGEVLRIDLDVTSMSGQGPLFETAAGFQKNG
jgi:hypothetical protein